MSMVDARPLCASDPEALLEVRHIGKSFGKKVAVRDLNLTVRPGHVCGFIGANGGGKTTALRLLAALIRPDCGSGSLLGQDIFDPSADIRRQIGYVTQHFSLYPELTAAENLRFRADLFGLRRPKLVIERTLSEFGLEGFAQQKACYLSGGWKQRLQFAAGLIHAPRLALLDEPTAGLDVLQRGETWTRIFELARGGAGVVVCTHDLAEAEACSTVVLFADGAVIAAGSPHELLSKLVRQEPLSQGRGLAAVTMDLLSPYNIAYRRL
jgi:ABC-2 type transport system ATP-binding protein